MKTVGKYCRSNCEVDSDCIGECKVELQCCVHSLIGRGRTEQGKM